MSYYRVAPGRPFHAPYHDREYGFPVRDDAARVAAYGRRERDARHPLSRADWVALFERTFRFTGGEMARRQPRWMRA